ncbi:HIT domain-containing protein [Microbacterium sp. BWR-S6Y]|uniref:HIT family protein n=1 Tax=Microbacterium sp. BWR-S6Y TaxID=3232073 RepID=UPI003528020C
MFGSVAVFLDGYPVTAGHALIVPLAHRRDYFDLTLEELLDTDRALTTLRDEFVRTGVTDFNIGWNSGAAAGQTISHAHCHLIPRRPGDMEDPTGGVRGVIPEKRLYAAGSSMRA